MTSPTNTLSDTFYKLENRVKKLIDPTNTNVISTVSAPTFHSEQKHDTQNTSTKTSGPFVIFNRKFPSYVKLLFVPMIIFLFLIIYKPKFIMFQKDDKKRINKKKLLVATILFSIICFLIVFYVRTKNPQFLTFASI